METLTVKDKKIFNFDARFINWDEWIVGYVAGMRRFILREDPSTLPKARASLRR